MFVTQTLLIDMNLIFDPNKPEKIKMFPSRSHLFHDVADMNSFSSSTNIWCGKALSESPKRYKIWLNKQLNTVK